MERKILTNEAKENLNSGIGNLVITLQFSKNGNRIPFRSKTLSFLSSHLIRLFPQFRSNFSFYKIPSYTKLGFKALLKLIEGLFFTKIIYSTKNFLKYHLKILGGNLGQLIVPKVFYFKV